MGLDKARLAAPCGQTLAAATAATLGRVTRGEIALVRRGPADGLPWVRHDGTPLRVVREPAREPHALWGVVSALEDARGVVITAPCDLPFLDEETVRRLVAGGPGGVAEVGGRVQPLLAVWPPEAVGRLRKSIARHRPATEAVADFRRVVVPPESVVNVNRPEEICWVGPLARLRERTPSWSAVMAEGERSRLRARGVLTWE